MVQPYSQPLFWVPAAITPTLGVSNDMSKWFNGLPEPGTTQDTIVLGAVKYWFNGLPGPLIKG